MKKHSIWIIGIIVLVVVALFAWKLTSRPENSLGDSGVAGNPIDITLDFYGSWLAHREQGNSATKLDDLLHARVLSDELRERLKDFDFSSDETTLDPVLCQTTLPEGFRSKFILENEDMVQLLVLSSEKGVSNQAMVTLSANGDLWVITDISCNAGEQAPDRGEFNFDHTGHLLKDSLPESFDRSNWHLVFSQNNVPGHTAILFFDSTSTCTDTNGTTNTCDPDNDFHEAMGVRVQGDLTEEGVNVHRIEFIPEI